VEPIVAAERQKDFAFWGATLHFAARAVECRTERLLELARRYGAEIAYEKFLELLRGGTAERISRRPERAEFGWAAEVAATPPHTTDLDNLKHFFFWWMAENDLMRILSHLARTSRLRWNAHQIPRHPAPAPTGLAGRWRRKVDAARMSTAILFDGPKRSFDHVR
jgi:hypothetical protein